MEGARLQDHFAELIEFGRQLALQTDPRSSFKLAAEGACRLSQAWACSIWVVSATRPQITFHTYNSASPASLSPFKGQRYLRQVVKEGKPLLFTSRQTTRNGLQEQLGSGPAALLPLPREGGIGGVIGVAGGDRVAFSEEELAWLQLIAGQVELGLRAAEARTNQERLKEQLGEVTRNLGKALSFSHSPTDFVRLVTDLVLKLSLADRAFGWLVKDGQPTQVFATARARGKAPAISKASASSLARRALREHSACGWRETGSWPAGSALAIPLLGKSGPMGAISLYWVNAQAYSDTERNLLLSFACQAEMALDNLLLQQAREKNLAQLIELSGAAERMASCPDSSALMKTTVRTTAAALRSPITAVALLQQSGHLTLAPHGYQGIKEAQAAGFRFLPTRGSLTERALSGKEAVALPAGASAQSDPLAKLLGTGHLACAPLLATEGPLGILIIGHHKAYDFRPTELTLLSTYASQAALALRNAMLCDDFTKHLDRLAAFSEYARTLASSLDLSQTLKTILHSASPLLEADSSCIMLRGAEDGKLKIRACSGHGAKAEHWAKLNTPESNEGLLGTALEQDKVLVSKDLARDGRCKQRLPAQEKGPASAIIAPLKARGKSLGLLCLFTDEPRSFDDQDKRLVSMLADGAGIAIENAGLYQEEKNRSNQLSSVIHEVNHRIRNNLQAVAGLLEMELIRNEHISREALRKSIDRIHCIGAVHGLLSRENIQQVEMKESARRIGEIACQSAGRSREEVALVVTGARVMLDSQKATALTLAIHELLDNSLRHGLSTRRPGRIVISFTQSDREVMVTVSDDGVGLPADFSLESDEHSGLKIVSGLAAQDLEGEFQLFSKNGGTTARIRFPHSRGAEKALPPSSR